MNNNVSNLPQAQEQQQQQQQYQLKKSSQIRLHIPHNFPKELHPNSGNIPVTFSQGKHAHSVDGLESGSANIFDSPSIRAAALSRTRPAVNSDGNVFDGTSSKQSSGNNIQLEESPKTFSRKSAEASPNSNSAKSNIRIQLPSVSQSNIPESPEKPTMKPKVPSVTQVVVDLTLDDDDLPVAMTKQQTPSKGEIISNGDVDVVPSLVKSTVKSSQREFSNENKSNGVFVQKSVVKAKAYSSDIVKKSPTQMPTLISHLQRPQKESQEKSQEKPQEELQQKSREQSPEQSQIQSQEQPDNRLLFIPQTPVKEKSSTKFDSEDVMAGFEYITKKMENPLLRAFVKRNSGGVPRRTSLGADVAAVIAAASPLKSKVEDKKRRRKSGTDELIDVLHSSRPSAELRLIENTTQKRIKTDILLSNDEFESERNEQNYLSQEFNEQENGADLKNEASLENVGKITESGTLEESKQQNDRKDEKEEEIYVIKEIRPKDIPVAHSATRPQPSSNISPSRQKNDDEIVVEDSDEEGRREDSLDGFSRLFEFTQPTSPPEKKVSREDYDSEDEATAQMYARLTEEFNMPYEKIGEALEMSSGSEIRARQILLVNFKCEELDDGLLKLIFTAEDDAILQGDDENAMKELIERKGEKMVNARQKFLVVPMLLQFGLQHLGLDSRRRPPVFDDVTVLGFAADGIILRLSMLIPLPLSAPLPHWFFAGVAEPPTLLISWRRSNRNKDNSNDTKSELNGTAAASKLYPLVQVTLSDPITVGGGETDALAFKQERVDVRFVDVDALRKLVRRMSLQIKKGGAVDELFIHVSMKVSIQVMGFIIWPKVSLAREIDVAPLIEIARQHKLFSESTINPASFIPPPLVPENIPDFLGLDSVSISSSSLLAPAAESAGSRPQIGPLHLYKSGTRKIRASPQSQEFHRIGIEGLFPNPKIHRLSTTTTSFGSVKSGIRATFSPLAPSLHLTIARVDFNVHLNNEKVASGTVGRFELGNGNLVSDLNVEVLPDVAVGGARGMIRGALGGARGLFRGVIVGALSGFTGGEFGDGSTVVNIDGINVYAHDENGDEINVIWIRELVAVVDLEVDIN
ncbi:hypothetical protein HK100_007163, partial [Physocladia obscura]